MEYKIPLFDLNFDEKEERAIVETLRSKWISTGPKNLEFERKFSLMLNIPYSLALTNCTVALHLALKVLGIGEEDEVICPSLTFVATVNSIKYVGAIPIFADIISNEELTIDPIDIEKKISRRTKAIIVMHYGGFACQMDKILEIAQKHNLKIIEDACHGPLSEYSDKKLGSLGDIGCFSFFSNKNISTGEGGMLVTNKKEYYEKAKLLRSHGMTSLSYERAKGHVTSYDVTELGFNYRMDDIRATIGIVQLDKLENDLRKRAKLREYYIEKLTTIDGIVIPFERYNIFCSNYIFPIVLKNSNARKRETIREELHVEGIQTSVHYPAVHRFSIYKENSSSLPITEYVTDNEITLPIYSSLKMNEIDFISKVLDKAIKNIK
jgi:dTDP-4-amino-4,6-dideoxygalactose transaminase